MTTFKFTISDKQKSYSVEKDQGAVLGKKLGETIKGETLGLDGYELKITGGSDKDGFPMRKDIEGQPKRKMILTRGTGFSGVKRIKKNKYKRSGLRKRKTVRGNTINADIKQVNLAVIKTGEKPLAELFPSAPKADEEKDKKQ